MYHFKNLVFEGGGVKGTAYVGAMEVLESRGILKAIERIGGTSAGAINAMLFGLGYTAGEIKSILMDLDFNNFLDDSWGVVRDTERLLSRFGWYKGDFFRTWIGDRIKDKCGDAKATFADLRLRGFRDMYIVGTNLSTGLYEVFSFENTPTMSVADAVRISMSIPLYFVALRSARGDVYVDGGVLDNYPIRLFDRAKYVNNFSSTPDYYRSYNTSLLKNGSPDDPYVYNQETLGFRLASAAQIGVFRDHTEPLRNSIDSFHSFIKAIISTYMGHQESIHLHSNDWQRTIYIDSLGVGTTDFNVDAPSKEALIQSGRSGTENYFKWYDDPHNRPVNRP